MNSHNSHYNRSLALSMYFTVILVCIPFHLLFTIIVPSSSKYSKLLFAACEQCPMATRYHHFYAQRLEPTNNIGLLIEHEFTRSNIQATSLLYFSLFFSISNLSHALINQMQFSGNQIKIYFYLRISEIECSIRKPIPYAFYSHK